VTLLCASIAPLDRLQADKERMGWQFPWVSSLGSDFNYDFGAAFTDEQQKGGAEYNFRHVDEPAPQREGMSAFAIQDGVVHHTASGRDGRRRGSILRRAPALPPAPAPARPGCH
jgi:predicted dithiol-disulfide oxidoreductase (DUF899 family)